MHPPIKSLLCASLLLSSACAERTDDPAGGPAGEQPDTERRDASSKPSSADGGLGSNSDAARGRDASSGSDAASERDAASAMSSNEAGTAQTARDASSAAGDARAASASGDASAAQTGSCGSALLCSDFEGASGAAMVPEGWSPSTPDCSGDGKLALDDAVAHGGKRSLRVSSSGGFCNHMFATPKVDLASLSDELWLRMYVRFEKAPGNEHVTFVSMHDQVSSKNLRVGFQSGILMWNREKDDATLPELSPTGISLSVMPKAQSWQCLEFHLAGSRGALETFVDGTRVDGLIVDGMPTQDVDGQWLRPGAFRAKVDDLRLGWESYGSTPMTVWFDDVAVGAARIGC